MAACSQHTMPGRKHGISNAGHVSFCTEETSHVGIYLNAKLETNLEPQSPRALSFCQFWLTNKNMHINHIPT